MLKKRTRKMLSLILVVLILLSNQATVYATELGGPDPNQRISGEAQKISTEIDTKDALETGETVESDEINSSIEDNLQEDVSSDTVSDAVEKDTDEGNTIVEEETADFTVADEREFKAADVASGEEAPFYRELDEEEIDAKNDLAEDVKQISEAEEGEDYVSNEVVHLCDSLEEAQLVAEAYAKATGYTVKVSSYSYGVAVFSISGKPTNPRSTNAVQSLVAEGAKKENNLPAVYPNYYRTAHAVNTKNESFTDPQLKADNEYYQWYHEKINDKFVWEQLDGGKSGINTSNVAVAVIDTGINKNHADFGGKVIESKNFYEEYNGTTANGENDYTGHGTNVAGILGAVANSIDGRGVASGINIISLRVFSADSATGAEDANIVRALNYVYNSGTPKAKVINLSLGGSYYNSLYIEPLRDLHDKNVTIVASAGNEATSVSMYPASYEHVISVAALNMKGQKTSYSNYGWAVDIAAPGGESGISANVQGFFDEESLFSVNLEGETTPRGLAGTSQAAPIVSAAAALLYAKDSGITPDEVESILERTASPVSSSYKIGAGCVDVAAALDIDTLVEAPVSIRENGEELVSGSITTGIPLHFREIKNGVIYYTINGKNPDPEKVLSGQADVTKASSGGTYLYDPANPIYLGGTGKVTVKAVALKFGITSAVSSYTYIYDTSLVQAIEVLPSKEMKQIDGAYQIGIGKKLALKANVMPTYAKNKNVTWSSSDTSVATVDAKGNVSALAEGTTIVTATALDGSNQSGSVNVTVKPLIKSLQIVTSQKNIVIDSGNTYTVGSGDLGKNNCTSAICIYPQNLSPNVVFSSAKPAIASVDATTGTITAVSSGTTTITMTAADGSGIKATVDVKVETPIYTISVTDKNGLNKVATGKTITPTVIFNEGKTKPDDTKLTWSITEGSSYVENINLDTGLIKIKDNIIWGINGAPKIVKVQASTPNGKVTSEPWVIEVYPITQRLDASSWYFNSWVGFVDNVWNLGNLGYLSIYPENTMGVSYKSSNPKVVAVDNDGGFACLSEGTAIITLTALDGSGKTARLGIFVDKAFNSYSWGIESPMEHNVIYPGKSITFKAVETNILPWYKNNMYVGIPEKRGDEEWISFDHDYLQFSKLKVFAKSKMQYVQPGTIQEVGSVSYDSYAGGATQFWNKTTIEMYPAGTTNIALSKYKNGTEEVINANGIILEPKEVVKLAPHSLPENACQKYYTYKSSNTKVATVDSTGRIKGIANGTATITVTAGDGSGKKATCKVTVCKNATSVGISSKTGSFEVAIGKVLQLSAAVDAAAGKKGVEWSCSGNSYISVDKNGKVSAKTGIQPGDKATIRATALAGGVYAEKEVIFKNATSDIEITHGGTAITLDTKVGGNRSQSKNISYVAVSSSASSQISQKCLVTSSNAKVAVVTNVAEGNFDVQAVGVGTANIKIAAADGSGKSATVKVTVKNPVTELNIGTKTIVDELLPGKNIQLVANTNSDATDKNVTWSIISGGDKVTIDAKGKLVANSNATEGTITVRAVSVDNSTKIATRVFSIKSQAVSSVAIKSNNTVVTSATLCTGDNIGNLKQLADWTVSLMDATGTKMEGAGFAVISSNLDIATAQKTETGIRVTAGTKVGIATITVTATDGSGKKTTLPVTVVNPVRRLQIKSATNNYNLASGTSVQLQAIANADATNKTVTWKVTDGSAYASISSVGVLTIGSVTEKRTVTVSAVPLYGTSVTKSFDIYPASSGIAFYNTDNASVGQKLLLKKGDKSTIKINSTTNNAYQSYYVTYTGSAAKVSYTNNVSASGTEISVEGISEGTVTIQAIAQDGSNQNAKYIVEIYIPREEALAKFHSKYPAGTPWGNNNYYAWSHSGLYSGGYGCAGFAFMESDALFGKTMKVKK